MECPLCEGSQLQVCGKTVTGNRKYHCSVCRSFFTLSNLLSPTTQHQFRLPEINLLNDDSRLPLRQKKYTYSWIAKLITLPESYLSRAFSNTRGIIAIACLYQLILVIITLCQLIVNQSPFSWEGFINRFSNNDGHHYVFVSQHGYQRQGEGVEFIVFFPLYPLLIHLFTFFVGNPYIAGILISNISSIVGHAAFAMFLVARGMPKRKVARIMLLLFLTPISIYFTMVYTEGVFLAATALCLYFLEKRQYSLAAIAGCGAALSRSLGFFCIIPYLAYALRHKHWQTKKKILLQSLVIPMGTFIYLGINTWLFKDPFYYRIFMKSIWHKELANPISQYFKSLNTMFQGLIKGDWTFITFYIDQITTLLFPLMVFIYMIIVISKQRKINYGLMIWSIAQWLIIASQSFWLSNTRYIGLILPCYIMLEEIMGASRYAYVMLAAVCGGLALYGINLFAKGQWLY